MDHETSLICHIGIASACAIGSAGCSIRAFMASNVNTLPRVFPAALRRVWRRKDAKIQSTQLIRVDRGKNERYQVDLTALCEHDARLLSSICEDGTQFSVNRCPGTDERRALDVSSLNTLCEE